MSKTVILKSIKASGLQEDLKEVMVEMVEGYDEDCPSIEDIMHDNTEMLEDYIYDKLQPEQIEKDQKKKDWERREQKAYEDVLLHS